MSVKKRLPRLSRGAVSFSWGSYRKAARLRGGVVEVVAKKETAGVLKHGKSGALCQQGEAHPWQFQINFFATYTNKRLEADACQYEEAM